MQWYWYSARNTELFVDCDNWSRSESHIRRRLMGAIESKKINVRDVYLFKSPSINHMHMIVILAHPSLTTLERVVWEIIFHSDIYRGCCNIMRELTVGSFKKGFASDVLIADHIYHREPDAQCDCKEKHKGQVMHSCTAAMKLRGHYRMQTFFGKPSNSPCPWF